MHSISHRMQDPLLHQLPFSIPEDNPLPQVHTLNVHRQYAGTKHAKCILECLLAENDVSPTVSYRSEGSRRAGFPVRQHRLPPPASQHLLKSNKFEHSEVATDFRTAIDSTIPDDFESCLE